MIYHRKTNKHCATAEASRVRQRKNMLKQYAGVKRKYGEINNAFWRGVGKQDIVARAKLHSYKKREGSVMEWSLTFSLKIVKLCVL